MSIISNSNFIKTLFQNLIPNLKKAPLTKLSSDVFEGRAPVIKYSRPSNYVEPVFDSFNSIIECINYAKGRVIEALTGSKPYEHLVVIEKNTRRILGEYKGYAHRCYSFDLNLDTPTGKIFIHGHPTHLKQNGKALTTPVSFSDCLSITSYKDSEIYAFSADGKYSLLRQKPGFKGLSEEQKKYYQNLHFTFLDRIPKHKKMSLRLKAFCDKHFSKAFKNCSTTAEYNLAMRELREKNPEQFEKMLKCLPAKEEREFNELTKEYENYVRSDINIFKMIDSFWRRYADEMGFIYKTNYSYLK